MSPLGHVWSATHAHGFAAAVLDNDSSASVSGSVNLHRESLKARWQLPVFQWRRQRKRDLTPTITLDFASGSLFLPRSSISGLFVGGSNGFEFLPAQIGDEDWVVVHLTSNAVDIDEATSDLTTLDLPSGRQQVVSARWLTVVGASAVEFEVFCLRREPQLHFLCTDAFVERVQLLGLRGLDFKHVGYIVADASQAVPKPPEPPKPPAAPSRRRHPSLTALPLPASEQIDLAQAASDWRARLNLAKDAPSEVVLQRLKNELAALRPTFFSISAEERLEATLGLSAIYGELVCKHAGWKWIELRENKRKQWIAVGSADGHHALTLLSYIQQQITANEPTLELLFNMICAGSLPQAEPGNVKVIA
jgi:hypothetical protein